MSIETPPSNAQNGKRPQPRKKASGVKRRPETGPARLPRPATARAKPVDSAGESRTLALAFAAAGLDKKAIAVEILDVVGRVDYADFLVLMTGGSARQVDALAQAMQEAGLRQKKRALSVEGRSAAAWVLLDFGDVVVHVFQEDARNLYDIDGLWLDARRLPVKAGKNGVSG